MSQECKMCLFYEKNCHKHRANPHPDLTGKQETQKRHGTNHSATCQTVKPTLARILYSGPDYGESPEIRDSRAIMKSTVCQANGENTYKK